MTDAEIIKGVKCCINTINTTCTKCPYIKDKGCASHLAEDFENLINRQKAEIERKVDEQKYNKAILVLQAIAQHRGSNGRGSNEYFDEWTQARAFKSCREAALRCLKYLGEPVTMTNKRNGG